MPDKSKTESKTRVRKLDYKSKKKSVKISEPIPSSFSIFTKSVKHIWLNKKLFAGIMIVYALLYLLLVKGFATNFQLADTKENLEEAANNLNTASMGLVLFGSLLGSSGSAPNQSAGVYQVLLLIVISLALIWALRQTYDSPKKLKIKQAFYSGMFPFVTYILVWLVILLQLLPALIGISLYGIVSSSGIAVGLFENLLWLMLAIIAFSTSVYMTSSSIFATYIVALPNMTPLTALKKAKSVVKFRRFAIIRKVLFFPAILLIFALIIFVPLVLYATFLAEIMFLIFTIISILLWHAYLYNLYRGLI